VELLAQLVKLHLHLYIFFYQVVWLVCLESLTLDLFLDFEHELFSLPFDLVILFSLEVARSMM